jgi:hypothetical protein
MLKYYLGLIWGFFMIYQDINTYILYVLLLLSAPDVIDCSNFLKYYTTFSLINTIVMGLFSPISGWLVDYFNTKQILQLIIITITHLIVFISQFQSLFSNNSTYNWISLCIIYQIFQIVNVQNNNVLWKVIKKYIDETQNNINVDPLYISNNNPTENDRLLVDMEPRYVPTRTNTLSTVNMIGNIGDLTSDVCESIIIGSLALILFFVKEIWASIYFILLYLSIWLCLVNITVTIVIYVIYNRSQITSESNVVNIQTDNKDNNLDVNVGNEILGGICIGYLKYFIGSIKEFYNNKIVFNAMWHCVLLDMFISLIQYPIAYSEINYFVRTDETPNIFNFCGAEVINLFIMGAISSISYLCGSIFYAIFIVNAKSVTFYRVWYPAACFVVLGCTIALSYDLPTYVAIILISISQIIPYYLTYYDYYLFTEYADTKSYGFILSVYGVLTTTVTVIMQYFYLIDIPYAALIIIGIILLIINIIYSYYIAYLCKGENFPL